MFCFSLRSTKQRILMLSLGIVIIVICALVVNGAAHEIPVAASVFPSGETQNDRLLFLKQFGWIVDEDPISVDEVLIPSQFGDVYTNYNAIQSAQGFDLLPYAGRSVEKWVYAVTNYPGYAQSEVYVRATLLICQGRIIGGDICSVELDGFMHGFAYNSAY